MAKTALATRDDIDISRRVQGYFERLEAERGDLQRECELLQSQLHDRERALAASDAKNEQLVTRVEQLEAQRSQLMEQLYEATTTIDLIDGVVAKRRAAIAKTAGSLKQQAMAVPPKNGGQADAFSNDAISKIAETFRPAETKAAP